MGQNKYAQEVQKQKTKTINLAVTIRYWICQTIAGGKALVKYRISKFILEISERCGFQQKIQERYRQKLPISYSARICWTLWRTRGHCESRIMFQSQQRGYKLGFVKYISYIKVLAICVSHCRTACLARGVNVNWNRQLVGSKWTLAFHCSKKFVITWRITQKVTAHGLEATIIFFHTVKGILWKKETNVLLFCAHHNDFELGDKREDQVR